MTTTCRSPNREPNYGTKSAHDFLGGLTMIKKDKTGYKVVSEKGKNLGSGYKTRAAAAKRLRQVEYFKHKKG
jgi:hypothetical protein